MVSPSTPGWVQQPLNQIQLQIKIQKPFRRRLRWLMRVTFVGCNKSNQKCALQAAAVRGAGRSGLGVWCQASVFDCGSSCTSDAFLFGAWAMTGFRLRWLLERGCLDRACTDRPGMLKRVPVSGGERDSGLVAVRVPAGWRPRRTNPAGVRRCGWHPRGKASIQASRRGRDRDLRKETS